MGNNTDYLKKYIYDGEAILGSIQTEEIHSNLEEVFKAMIKEKSVFVVKVSGVRKDAVTVNVHGEYMGIIPKAQVSHRMYVRNNMDELIGQNIPVVMKSFNPNDKTCELSREFAVRNLRNEFLNEILPQMKDINLDDNEPNYKKYTQKFDENSDPFYDKYPRVKAKVMSFDPEKNKITVNVAGLDILGVMDISKFDHKYIYNPERYIEKYMKPNTVIEVALLAYYDNSVDGKPSNFVCSRRHTLSDPWKGLEKKVRRGDMIIVRALEKKEGHFFGAYDNFPLDIKCYYPDTPDRQLKPGEIYGRRLVRTGNDYTVKIVTVNSNNRVLTAEYVREI